MGFFYIFVVFFERCLHLHKSTHTHTPTPFALGSLILCHLTQILKSLAIYISKDSFSPHDSFLCICLYFCLCRVFVAARGLSLVAASRDYSSVGYTGFSLQRLLLLQSTGARVWASVVAAEGFNSCGLVAPWHVGSSWNRDQTCVSCISRRIHNHWTTKEFLHLILKSMNK